MLGLRTIACLSLALALAAGAAAHNAAAAAMALPMAMEHGAGAGEPCELCDAEGMAEAAAHCALICSTANGVLAASGALSGGLAHQPASGAPGKIAGRFAGPEPDPPRPA